MAVMFIPSVCIPISLISAFPDTRHSTLILRTISRWKKRNFTELRWPTKDIVYAKKNLKSDFGQRPVIPDSFICFLPSCSGSEAPILVCCDAFAEYCTDRPRRILLYASGAVLFPSEGDGQSGGTVDGLWMNHVTFKCAVIECLWYEREKTY